MAPQPTWRTFIAAGKETTKGTGVVPTLYIPMTKFDPSPVVTQLEDMGMRGSAIDSYGSQQGKRWSSLSADGNVHVDTFGIWLLGLFGEEAISGAGPYTHNFTVLNSGTQQPPGISITDTDILDPSRYAAFTPSDLTLNFSPDGLLTYSLSGLSLYRAAVSAPTPTWTAIKPMQGWRGTASINGAAATLLSATIKFGRSVNPILGTTTTQDPDAFWVGRQTVSIDATVLREDTSHAVALAADDQGFFDLTLDRGAGAAQEQLKVRCTTAAYTKLDQTRGNDWLELGVSLKAQGNTTDVGTSAGFGLAKVTLINARSTVY